MKWPHEPVKGRYIPICPCDECGKLLIDEQTKWFYPHQTWGEVDGYASDLDVWPAYYYGNYFLCKTCNKKKQDEKAATEKEKYIRNCCVCGDPFNLWSKRIWTKVSDIVCTKKSCKTKAMEAFNQTPFRNVKPTKLLHECSKAVYRGEMQKAQVIYAICYLLKTSRRKK